ncbi:MAG: GT-D fold domain-containing glycosyltransferase [Oscillospiraceae bacterium]
MLTLRKSLIKINNRLITRSKNILTPTESIEYITENHCSIARYGDGEMTYIIKKSDIWFQNFDESLRKRLLAILKGKHNSKLIVGIPYSINSTEFYPETEKTFWQSNMQIYRVFWHYLCKDKLYIDSLMFRLYNSFDSSDQADAYEKIKSIFNNKKCLIIEGENSKLGVNNNIFEYADKVSRIICPSKNVWNKYDMILKKAISFKEDFDLILVSLGPTATVLADDLANEGMWCIDIGQINVAELVINEATPAKFSINEADYFSQIICELT